MTKKEQSKTVRQIAKVTKYVTPVLQVVIALGALVILLGLATKGAQSYLVDIDETQKLVAAIIVVVLLSYSIATGLKRILK